MISRIWHGWTTPANADAYETLLRSEIFPWIEGRHLTGFRGIQLLRRTLGDAVEFLTLRWGRGPADSQATLGPAAHVGA